MWFLLDDPYLDGLIEYMRPECSYARPTRKQAIRAGTWNRGYYRNKIPKHSEQELACLCPLGTIGRRINSGPKVDRVVSEITCVKVERVDGWWWWVVDVRQEVRRG